MSILVLNSGSSSIKYELFKAEPLTRLASGLVEKIGEELSMLTHMTYSNQGQPAEYNKKLRVPDHTAALNCIVEVLLNPKHGAVKDSSEIAAVGHRVVHGSETFNSTTVIDDDVIKAIKENIRLAPLHNPPNLKGIEIAKKIFPNAIQVAVFDTAFHHSIPKKAFLYAIPLRLYKEEKIRRYGFHGTSHSYVADQAAKFLHRPFNTLNLITIHLGNGASMAAVRQGRCIDTSMGMTPLEGLVMGTRSGDIDPALPFFLADQLEMSYQAINELLNRESGLKGLCGTNDMRTLLEMKSHGDRNASLALEVYCYRIKKYIGAYYAALGPLDALVFTAGIGENSPEVRELACEGLEHMGISIDNEKNYSASSDTRDISTESSKVRVLVIPTDEELKIAMETLRAIKEKSQEG